MLIAGNGANQELVAGGGNDTLIAGSGANQELSTGAGNGTLIGGSGNDVFVVFGPTGSGYCH